MAVVSRRDLFIEYIKQELFHGFALSLPDTYAATWGRIQSLVDEHREYTARGESDQSTLKRLVPTVAVFLTSLPLEEAWLRYDAKYAVSRRMMVPPSFNEVRHTLNLAQVMALAGSVEMVSFDGDQTLYSDGGNFGDNVPLARTIGSLLQQGVYVILITAAGYGLEAPRYEQRVQGLLDFLKAELEAEAMQRFFVLGGECNFLFRCGGDGRLAGVPVEQWQPEELGDLRPCSWPQRRTQQLLDVAEETMRASVRELRLRATLIRKSRAVGIVPGGEASVAATPVGHGSNKMKKEALDEVVLRCQQAINAHLRTSAATNNEAGGQGRSADATADATAAKGPGRGPVPFCAFNGGRDAWVDVGNKEIGVLAMQAFLKVESRANCLHVGDQFLDTGNDVAARNCCPCIWILNPKETLKVLQILLGLMRLTDQQHVQQHVQQQQQQQQQTAEVEGGAAVGALLSSPEEESAVPAPGSPLQASVRQSSVELSRTLSPVGLELVPELALSSAEVTAVMARPPPAAAAATPGSPIIKSASAVQLALDLSSDADS